MSEERLAVLEVHIEQAGYDEVPDIIKGIHFNVRTR